jgi:hypothetical protein
LVLQLVNLWSFLTFLTWLWRPITFRANLALRWGLKQSYSLVAFDPCNCFLKIWKSTRTPTPKMGVHLGVWVFIVTLCHTLGSLSWPTLLQTFALVVIPKLGLRHSCLAFWCELM